MPMRKANIEHSLFDVLPDAVLVLDVQKRLSAMNPAAETLFGASAAEMLGKPVAELFADEDSAADLFGIGKELSPDCGIQYINLKRRVGPPFSAQLTISPMVDARGSFAGVMAILRDVSSVVSMVTRAQDADRAVMLRLSSLEAVLNRTTAFLFHMDDQAIIRWSNVEFARLLGSTPEAIIGKPLTDFVSAELKELVRTQNAHYSEANPSRIYQHRAQLAPDRYRHTLWSSHAAFDNGSISDIVCFGLEVTALLDRSDKISQQVAELQRKNEALGQFAAIVSHDLKAPLRHIAMFADMINDDVAQQKYNELSVYAHHVRSSTIKMDRVIKSLLQYSQIAYRLVATQRIDLATIVIQAVQNLENQIDEARAEILLGNLGTIEGDQELIRHLIQNLLSNAVKYRKPGTRPKVRIHSTEDSEFSQIIVEDNGIGIDPKHSARIFGPFQRLHKDESVYEGFGIGLALCKQIAESHNGSIELDPTYSDGARFIVRIARAAKSGGAIDER